METGKAYILRTCSRDMTSRGDFTWPRGGEVSAPDWRATSECGNGLHGFLWGEGDGGLADWSLNAIWIVAGIDHWIDLGGKVKFPKANVVFAGSRAAATAKIIELGARGAVIGSTLIGGDYSTLTGGDHSTLTGGYSSTLTGGARSTLTGGYRSTLTGGGGSTLTGGDHSTLTGGDHSTLTGGARSTLTGGYGSTLTGGYGSTLTAKWLDGLRYRIAVAYVGEDGIEPGAPYRVVKGKFEAAK